MFSHYVYKIGNYAYEVGNYVYKISYMYDFQTCNHDHFRGRVSPLHFGFAGCLCHLKSEDGGVSELIK